MRPAILFLLATSLFGQNVLFFGSQTVIPPASGPQIVQSNPTWTGVGFPTGTMVFVANPTAGNLLLVGCGASNSTVTPPSGFTTVIAHGGGTLAALVVYDHVVGMGETNSYTFSATNGVICNGYEISGQNATTPIDQASTVAYSASTISLATPSITPSILHDLPLSFFTPYSGPVSVTFSTGWTLDATNNPSSYDCTWSVHKNVNTTDTSTAISNTITSASGAQPLAAAAVLVRP